MAEEKKKKPDEGSEPEENKLDTQSEEEKEKPDTPEDKPKEGEEEKEDKKPVESGEGEKPEEKQEEKPEDEEKSKAPETSELSEADRLKAENLTLRTQLEAMKIGFTPDCMEDAVTLAEAIVKRDGVEIQAALQSVAKKYPDWKSDGKEKDKKSGGFKVGADNSDDKDASDDRLDQAFGIKKKK